VELYGEEGAVSGKRNGFFVSGRQERFLVVPVAFIWRFAYNTPVQCKENRDEQNPPLAAAPANIPEQERGSALRTSHSMIINIHA
jgi:hypothetical protein